jgi:hypothetical protein
MTTRSPTLTKRDYVDLVHGEFTQTTPSDLRDAFEAFRSSGTNHLAVFFHGGLVSRTDGKAEAEQLIGGYRKAGTYPFFFIWNSDILTVLQGPLFPFADNLVIRRVVERHILFFCAALLQHLKFEDSHGRLLRAIADLARDALPPPLTALAALGRVVDSIWARRRRDFALPPSPQSDKDIQAFEQDVARDVAAFGGMLNKRTPFTPALGSDIVSRVWGRLRSGHDHGLYTTVIEEIAVAMRLHRFLARVWNRMKRDIDLAFQSDSAHYGGTAFLEELVRVWKTDTRLTLIGHSAGTVYIDRMLNAIDQKLPDAIKADIVFIAAALSFDRFAATIDTTVFRRRVTNYRLFALKEECEAGYWEVPGVYDKSLLYLVSGLCEGDSEEDKPLVGMQRYWSGTAPYDTQAIRTVAAQIGSGARVWSPTDPNAPLGFRANARKHGCFARERRTNGSVQEFLRQ